MYLAWIRLSSVQYRLYGGTKAISLIIVVTEVGFEPTPPKRLEPQSIIAYGRKDDIPLDARGTPKDPLDELHNIITSDGRGDRRVITINGRFVGPTNKL